jgi:hypothetical protein
LVLEDLRKAGYSVRVDEATIREMDSYFGMIARRAKRPPGKILSERPTDAASYIARELLGKADIEICEVDKGDFHFSLSRQTASANASFDG